MKSRELSRQLTSLRALINNSSAACGGDVEMQSHWARYICVLAAGFIENSIEEVFGEFAKTAASEPIARYVRREFGRIQNPKSKRFVEIMRVFKEEWGDDMENYFIQDSRAEAIDSIMANRHQIAHGNNSGITLARVKEYLDKGVEVIEFIEVRLGI